MKSLYLINDGEKHWYVADTADHAQQLYIDEYGEIDGSISAEKLPPNEQLTIRLIEEPGEPKITKTAGEWAKGPYGLIASTVY